jgi:hypothetical protein
LGSIFCFPGLFFLLPQRREDAKKYKILAILAPLRLCGDILYLIKEKEAIRNSQIASTRNAE